MFGLNDEFRNIENDIYMPLMQSTVEFYSQISKAIILQMPLPRPQKSAFKLWSQLTNLRFFYFSQLKCFWLVAFLLCKIHSACVF